LTLDQASPHSPDNASARTTFKGRTDSANNDLDGALRLLLLLAGVWELTMNKSTTKRAKQEVHGLGEKTAKKPYVSPRLVEYGNVAKLTSGSGSGGVEGTMIGMSGIIPPP
jgi:hypothetical protein